MVVALGGAWDVLARKNEQRREGRWVGRCGGEGNDMKLGRSIAQRDGGLAVLLRDTAVVHIGRRGLRRRAQEGGGPTGIGCDSRA